MDWTTIGTQIFTVCIIPLLGLLTGYVVTFLKQKIDALSKTTNNELATKYLDMLKDTVANCILATNQTYVDVLKDKNAFDATAQKEAFNKTYEAVMANLTEEAKKYLGHVTNDLPTLVTELIESKIAQNKQ